MHALKEIILNIISDKPEIIKQIEFDLDKIWFDVVGEVISDISYPECLVNKKLIIRVNNPVWLNQLKIMKSEILNKIKNHPSNIEIEDIDFKAERRRRKCLEQEIEKPKIINEIDPNLEKEVDKVLNVIKDEEIKKVLKSIFIKSCFSYTKVEES